MAKADYVERVDMGFVSQMVVFKNNIGPLAAVLDVTPEQVAEQAADTEYYQYVVVCLALIAPFAKGATAYRNNLRFGEQPGPAAGMPALVFPPAPPAVPPGVEKRFRALVRRIKRHPKYELSIGKLLGIEGVEPTKTDPNELQPTFTLELRATGVFVGWSWDTHRAQVDMCELVVDRNDGQGERPLTCDSSPGFLDTEPFPAQLTKWTYRAVFRKDEFRVGQWSVPVSIVVGG